MCECVLKDKGLICQEGDEVSVCLMCITKHRSWDFCMNYM